MSATRIVTHRGPTSSKRHGPRTRISANHPCTLIHEEPQKRLQDYLSDNIWVTASGNFNDQALISAVLTVGADHIMFATDYPYDVTTDAARWIETAPISEKDRRKICYDNAADLFGLHLAKQHEMVAAN